MITDAMLRFAAAEAEEILLSQLPESQLHTFSPAFERKIKKLVIRAKHPVRYQALRYAAAVLLAILTLFGAVLAASPEVRASVIGWVRSTFGEYFQYTSDNAPKPVIAEYELTVIPDGYQQLQVVDKINGKLYIFTDESNHFMQFEFDCSGSNVNVFIDVENYEQYPCYVHSGPAEIYLSTKEDESNLIVWQDRGSNTIFRIYAMADADALIAMAESVQKIN